jgi:hypothetical protein
MLVKLAGSTQAWSSMGNGTLERAILFVGGGSHYGGKYVSGTRTREGRGDANPFFLYEEDILYTSMGKSEMFKRALVFLTHVRHSIQSDSSSGATLPGFGFHQQSFSFGPPTAYRLDEDTFHINCLSLSVSLGSKLIYTAPHDHYNWLYACQYFCRIAAQPVL